MSTRAKIWILPALLYASFVFWYTDFGGPLREDEIETFKKAMHERGESEQWQAEVEKFMREDTGRQFLMVNIMDINENPPNVEGAEPGESAQQLAARYMEHMRGELTKRACHEAILGMAVSTSIDIMGIENVEVWDAASMMRYRSRRSLMEVLANADQKDSHRFKEAALQKTFAFPVEMVIYLSDLRLLLALVLLSLTALLDIFFMGRSAKTNQ
jgi:hypothetical protein